MEDIWLRAVGDDNFVASVKYENQRKELADTLQNCLKSLINDVFGDVNNPDPGLVDDSKSQTFQPFAFAIECILRHGLQNVRANNIGKTSFWCYLENLEKVVPSSSKMIASIRNLQKVKSADGKGRAWIRQALNNNVLHEHLSELISREDLKSSWYETYAFLNNHSYVSFFTTTLIGLNALHFNLRVDDPTLDVIEPEKKESTSKKEPTSKKKPKKQKKKPSVVAISDAEDSGQSSNYSVNSRDSGFNRGSNFPIHSPQLSTIEEIQLSAEPKNMNSPSTPLQTKETPSVPIPQSQNSPNISDITSPNSLSPHTNTPSPIYSPNNASPHIHSPKSFSPTDQSPIITKPLELSPNPSPIISPVMSPILSSPVQSLEQIPKEQSPRELPSMDLFRNVQQPSQETEKRYEDNHNVSLVISKDEPDNGRENVEDFVTLIPAKVLPSEQVMTPKKNRPSMSEMKKTAMGLLFESKPEPKIDLKTELDPKPEPKIDLKTELDPKPEPKIDLKTELDPKPEPKIDLKTELNPKPEPKIDLKTELDPKPEPKIDLKTELDPKPEPSLLKQDTQVIQNVITSNKDELLPRESQIEKKTLSAKDIRKMELEKMKREVEEEIKRRKEEEEKLQREKAHSSLIFENIKDSPTSVEQITNQIIGSPPKIVTPMDSKKYQREVERRKLIEEARKLLENEEPSRKTPIPQDKSPQVQEKTEIKQIYSRDIEEKVSQKATEAQLQLPVEIDTNTTVPNVKQSLEQPTFDQTKLESPPQEKEFLEKEKIIHQKVEDESSNFALTNKYYQKYLNKDHQESDPINPLYRSVPNFSTLMNAQKSKSGEDLVPNRDYKSATFRPTTKYDLEVSASMSMQFPNSHKVVDRLKSESPSTVNRKKSNSFSFGHKSPMKQNIKPEIVQRKQLYFDVHEKGTPKDQDYLCHGCGGPLPRGVFAQVRYCEYTGKYYCKDCQGTDKFIIPARIMHKWDLKAYPVCHFAKNLLTNIYYEPVFDVSVVNPKLYEMVPSLKTLKVLRLQLRYMKDFILTCRDKDILMNYVSNSRLHLINDVDFFSLNDFLEINQGNLLDVVLDISEKFILHIKSCQLCKGKGSICEICRSDKVIYPFNLKSTTQCENCKGLFHKKCYKGPASCSKCLRKASYQQKRQSLQT